jgi:hypothetical protein
LQTGFAAARHELLRLLILAEIAADNSAVAAHRAETEHDQSDTDVAHDKLHL